ncbi:MAG: DUF5658 family protein [Acidobacteriota bacterium]
MNQTMLQYSYLQVLDFLTTVAFLVQGVQEGNPIVRFMMRYSSNPVTGLLVVKVIAIALGLYCWRVGKQRLLSRMTVMFAVIVAWNLGALILGSMA